MQKLLDKENPILRQKADSILPEEFKSSWLLGLIQEMFAIMEETGAVGVAAPQIGVSKQIIVFGTSYAKRRKPEVDIPNCVLINPTINILSEEMQEDYEGCLSTGELMGKVFRAKIIEYTGYDPNGNIYSKTVTDLEARIVQHEYDHLQGILFIDRIEDKTSLTTYTEFCKRKSV